MILLLLWLAGSQEAGREVERLRSNDPAEREAAYRRLKELGRAAEPDLVVAAKSSDTEVALRAKELLAWLDVERKMPASVVKRIPDAVDRVAAAGPPGWIPLFFEACELVSKADLDRLAPLAFEGAQSHELKVELCDKVGNAGVRGAIPWLLKYLSDPSLRTSAADALELLCAYELERDLLDGLKAADPNLRAGAAMALHRIFDSDAVAEISTLLRDENSDVRKVALGLVDEMKTREVSRELVPLLEDSDPDVREMTARMLGDWKEAAAIPGFLKLVGDPVEDVRRIAVWALGQSGGALPDAVFQDRSDAVRAVAVEVAGQERIPQLLDLYRSDATPPRVRAAAGRTLVDLNVREAAQVTVPSTAPLELRAAAFWARVLLEAPDAPDAVAAFLGDILEVRSHGESALRRLTLAQAKATFPLLVRSKDASLRGHAVFLARRFLPAEFLPDVVRLLADPSEQVRGAAVWALESVREALPSVRACLKDPDATVRERAMQACWTLAGPGAADDLAAMLSDPAPRVRRMAIDRLAHLGRPSDVPAFLEALGDGDDTVRGHAASALGRRAGPDRVPELSRRLQLNAFAGKGETIEVLSAVGGREAVDALLPLLDSAEFQLRRAAIQALERMRAVSAAPALLELLDGAHGGTREDVVRALGALNVKAAIPRLAPLVSDRLVRKSVVTALGELGATGSIPAVASCLEDEDWEIRVAACVALGDLGAKDRAGEVLRLLDDPIQEVRRAAREALGVLGAKEAVPRLFELLGRSYAVAEVLGSLEAHERIPDLRRLLKHRFAPLRADAATALAGLGCREAVPDLIDLLKDRKVRVRAAAAKALGRLGAREAAGPLVGLLRRATQDQWYESRAAVEALGRLRSREGLPEIAGALRSRDPQLRLVAMDTLRRLGAREALPEVLKVFGDREAYQRYDDVPAPGSSALPVSVRGRGHDFHNSVLQFFVPEVIADLDGRGHLPEIEKLLSHPSFDVRAGAAEALARLGSKAGVAHLLSTRRRLTCLNALRHPALWERLSRGILPRTTMRDVPGLWALVARELGLRWEPPPGFRDAPGPRSISRESLENLSGAATLLEVSEQLLKETDFELILETDRLRLVPTAEARAFWARN